MNSEGPTNLVEPTIISRDSLSMTSLATRSSRYEIPPTINTIFRPPWKEMGALVLSVVEFPVRLHLSVAPFFLRALPSRAFGRLRALPVPAELVIDAGIGITLGYSSTLRELVTSSFNIPFKAGTYRLDAYSLSSSKEDACWILLLFL